MGKEASDKENKYTNGTWPPIPVGCNKRLGEIAMIMNSLNISSREYLFNRRKAISNYNDLIKSP